MIFFCPICWKEIKGDDKKCSHCDADITEHEKKGFEEKLINALNHPERETVHRAVWILGRLKGVKAVKPLMRLFEKIYNPYIKASILDAFNEIATDDAIGFIMKSQNSREIIIKRKSKEITGGKK